jgi:molybdate transport system substrate-binding protein
MKKYFLLFFVTIMVFPAKAQLTPAVAANMKYAFEEIASAFGRSTGITVTPVYGSSGKLVTQIRNGAPFDLFISADVGFADSVCVSNLCCGKPAIYAYGKLVLWTTKPIDISAGAAILIDSSIQSIAVGDLKLTTYGPAARRLLEKENLWSSIEAKIIYGENVAMVAQFIASGAVDVGFTAKSMVLSDEMRGKGTWIEMDSATYDPLPQAAVMLSYGEINNGMATGELYKYLFGQEARRILVRYGYTVP